jgi:hypothetical protein
MGDACQRGDFSLHESAITRSQSADILHHVELGRALIEREARFAQLCLAQIRAQRKANHSAYEDG